MLNLRREILSLSLVSCTLLAGAGSFAHADSSTDVAVPTPAPIAEFRARQGYEATTLDSMEEAQELFNQERENGIDHHSQCFERAEVWSHDIYKHSLNRPGGPIFPMKVMMFYTPRFRNEFIKHSPGLFNDTYAQYEWWFHTAPVVYVKGQAEPIVLDAEFLKQPVTLDEWSHFFLNTDIFPGTGIIPQSNVSQLHLSDDETRCQLVSDFRDYAIPTLMDQGPGKSTKLSDFTDWETKRPANEPWCKMRIYPMYYMTPLDVQRMDCNPARGDVNYTMGLTGKHRGMGIGKAVFAKGNRGLPIYPCTPLKMTSFSASDLKNACGDVNKSNGNHDDHCAE